MHQASAHELMTWRQFYQTSRYLTSKQAAGVVTTQSATIHVYAKSEFTSQVLQTNAPDLLSSLGAWPLLLIVVDNKNAQASQQRAPQTQPATPLHQQQGPPVAQQTQWKTCFFDSKETIFEHFFGSLVCVFELDFRTHICAWFSELS